MRYFGVFLANLRSSANLSLEELASLVGTSRSTISRIENNEVPQPFKGSIRKVLLCVAELLCTSRTETERYLNLAGIERSLLTEFEQIQLGFVPHISKGSPEERAELERVEKIFAHLLKGLETRELELGVSNASPISSSKRKSTTTPCKKSENGWTGCTIEMIPWTFLHYPRRMSFMQRG